MLSGADLTTEMMMRNKSKNREIGEKGFLGNIFDKVCEGIKSWVWEFGRDLMGFLR